MSRPAARPTERVHRVGMAEESDGSCVALRMKRGREGEREKGINGRGRGMEKMREESVSETQSKAHLYFNRGKLDRALKRAVNVQRREGINYEAMDVERGSNDPP